MKLYGLADFRLHLFQRILNLDTAGQIGDVGGEIFLAFFDDDGVAHVVNPSVPVNGKVRIMARNYGGTLRTTRF